MYSLNDKKQYVFTLAPMAPIAAPKPPKPPFDAQKFAAFLEKHGFTRAIAGETDFAAALHAAEAMHTSGRGIIISGDFGCGKTTLAQALATAFGNRELCTIRLNLRSELEKLDPTWHEFRAIDITEQNMFLDDIGAESSVNEYGVRYEPVGDFIAYYHTMHAEGTRLFATTNLNLAQIDERYNGRITSRLKELCVPLRLAGKDKRQWLLIPKS